MNSQQLKATRGLRAAIEQWAGALRNGSPTETARAHQLDGIRAHMDRLQLPHENLDDEALALAVDELHELVLHAPRLPWQAFVRRLCAALHTTTAQLNRVTA